MARSDDLHDTYLERPPRTPAVRPRAGSARGYPRHRHHAVLHGLGAGDQPHGGHIHRSAARIRTLRGRDRAADVGFHARVRVGAHPLRACGRPVRRPGARRERGAADRRFARVRREFVAGGFRGRSDPARSGLRDDHPVLQPGAGSGRAPRATQPCLGVPRRRLGHRHGRRPGDLPSGRPGRPGSAPCSSCWRRSSSSSRWSPFCSPRCAPCRLGSTGLHRRAKWAPHWHGRPGIGTSTCSGSSTPPDWRPASGCWSGRPPSSPRSSERDATWPPP